ncbi:MAG TPA: heavy metal translocating P-type ATPase [Alphaproteobacteria bacterium]|nr:heavy metal translocating P-type ATPase [Alphaproteobacteria bacterium]
MTPSDAASVAISIAPTGCGDAAISACVHCGGPLSSEAIDGFCCRGCAAAYAIIDGLGLDAFYARRILDPATRPLKPEDDSGIDYARRAMTDAKTGMSTLHLMVDGLQCAACVWLIETVLAREPHVVEGRVNMSTRRLRLRWRGPASEGAALVHKLARLGFRLMPYDPRKLASAGTAAEQRLLRAMAVAGFAAGNVMLLSISVWSGEGSMGIETRDLMHWISALIAMPTIAYAGRPFFASAIGALRARRTNMDVPISIGVLLATAMSLFQTIHSQPDAYFDSSVTLVFFLLVGRYLDVRARGKARSAAEQLVALGATDVRVVRSDGVLESRPPDGVIHGEIVQVAAGERIGVDGRVVSGESELDTSLITGESLPQRAYAGSAVFSGTVNLTAPLRIEVTATGEATLLAEIARLLEAAEQGRGRHRVLADKVSRFYAPVVHGLAFVTFLGWLFLLGAPWQQALLNAISVLIVTCPCALALAVPAVQVVASGRLLRQGILLKSATALERLAQVDSLVFDKTGTLTLGRPEPLDPPSTQDLRAAASLAASSRHPLARALCRAAPGVPAAAGVSEHPGKGLSLVTPDGEIRLGSRSFCGVGDAPKTIAGPELWLARPGRAPQRFAFADRLRDDAAAVVAALKGEGLRVELLSGDRAATVANVARAAGIAEWRADITPAGKCARLADLRAQGHCVAMVGDGLNDAPALTAADVSLAPATAVDASQTAADIVLQGERLAPLLEALYVARKSSRLVRENLGIALGYNLLAVPLAVFGMVSPLVAAAAMSSSSLLVVGNALRAAAGGWHD